MGIFISLSGYTKNDSGDTDKPYVTEQSFRKNLNGQMTMLYKILAQLMNYGVTDSTTLKLEFFFYTDTEEKAFTLAAALKKLNYEVEATPSQGDEQLMLIRGWTGPIKMDESSVEAWTEQMVRLGYNHDCEFDGWGSNPQQ